MGCGQSITEKRGHQVFDVGTEGNIKFWRRIRDDASKVLGDLSKTKDNPPSYYKLEYKELLERFLNLYEFFGGNIPKYRFSIKGDANVAPFPLPVYLPGTSLTTRPWITNWVQFDLQLSPEGAWHMLPECGSSIPLLTPERLYRSWYTENTFRCGSFDGEAAWDVLPVDVIKTDTTTPEQDMILLKRNKRKDLYDEERMKRKRQELMNYFIKTYDTLNFDHEKHLKFAQALEAGWQKFQQLCQK
ncbi:unnamed protein product [Mytilus edulis]|uniref:Uncharacterized protein n=1 Tax=Mytilus edulis TaxID=6550 RepID=A0A8S3S0V7_MYTED|nr:unnamed protein product [Mytilus edulis]